MIAKSGSGSSRYLGCVPAILPLLTEHPQPGTYLDHDTDEIPYSDFINKELILFSMADNVRSIPSVCDGLKPGQRKVIWGCFKRKLKKEIKVRPTRWIRGSRVITDDRRRWHNSSVISPNTPPTTMGSKV